MHFSGRHEPMPKPTTNIGGANHSDQVEMKKSPLAFIIVLNWNGKAHLAECLGSLSCLDYSNFQILLVDNNSQDGSLALVASHYPHVQVIENSTNLGFAEGNNVGMRYALSQGADYVVLLNNDTRVEPDFLSHLVRRGEEQPEVGVLGGTVLMYSNPGIVNSTGVNLNQFAYGWDRDFGENSALLAGEGGEVLAVSGCLMAIKRAVMEKIGLLDGAFFAYYEDVDFCLRTWKDTDFTVEYVPGAVVHHKFSASSGASSPLKYSLLMKNRYRLFFKHFPPSRLVAIFPELTWHRLRFLWRKRRELRGLRAFSELWVLFKYWALFPYIVCRRLFRDRSEQGAARFWNKVIPEWNIPSFKAYSASYERIVLGKNGLLEAVVPSRIVMGVNDDLLGVGWSPLLHHHPRIRTVKGQAACYLRNDKSFSYIQLHGLCDSPVDSPCMELSIDGTLMSRTDLVPGWHTYVIPFENRFEEGPVELQLTVKTSNGAPVSSKLFGVNEVGLIPLDSPLLRLVER
jgi:GT2 family glycosyltransferase